MRARKNLGTIWPGKHLGAELVWPGLARANPSAQPATLQPQYSHSATVQPQYSHIRRSHSHSHSHGHSHSHSHTPIHEGIHTGGRREAPPPCVEAARSAASFMDGCVAVAVAVAEAVAVAVAEAGEPWAERRGRTITAKIAGTVLYLRTFVPSSRSAPPWIAERHVSQCYLESPVRPTTILPASLPLMC